MKLYRDENGHWSGTQADAKRELSNWYSFDVPTDKSGLLDFLNGNRVGNLTNTTLIEEQVQSSVDNLELSPTDKSNIKTAFEQAGAAREAMRRIMDVYQ